MDTLGDGPEHDPDQVVVGQGRPLYPIVVIILDDAPAATANGSRREPFMH